MNSDNANQSKDINLGITENQKWGSYTAMFAKKMTEQRTYGLLREQLDSPPSNSQLNLDVT